MLLGILLGVAVPLSLLVGWLLTSSPGDASLEGVSLATAEPSTPSSGAPSEPGVAPPTAETTHALPGLISCFVDEDGDGYGAAAVPGSPVPTCTGEGVSIQSGDCDDAKANVNPGASEVCDGLDNDCSGGPGADEVDGDGDGDPGCKDCDDRDRKRSHLVREIAADGVDQDCDNKDRCYLDGDGDGYGGAKMGASPGLSCAAPGFSAITGDCDDSDPSARPGGKEVAGDGRDNDCNGKADDQTVSTAAASPSRFIKVKLKGDPQASLDRKKKAMTVTLELSDPDKACRNMSLRWRSESMDGSDVTQLTQQSDGRYSASVTLPSKERVMYYPRCCYYLSDCVDLKSASGQVFSFTP